MLEGASIPVQLEDTRDAVLPPDRKCEFISRDALKQGSKARCFFQRELLVIAVKRGQF
jgi:hypothetical protein